MRSRTRLVVALVMATVLGAFAGTALAASAVSVNVPFEFMVNGKTMPEGTYQIQFAGTKSSVLIVRNVKNGQNVLVPVVTRLADLGGKEVSVVFDKVDGKAYLSELHVPGTDGFEIQGAPGKHTHALVSGTEQQ